MFHTFDVVAPSQKIEQEEEKTQTHTNPGATSAAMVHCQSLLPSVLLSRLKIPPPRNMSGWQPRGCSHICSASAHGDSCLKKENSYIVCLVVVSLWTLHPLARQGRFCTVAGDTEMDLVGRYAWRRGTRQDARSPDDCLL